MKKSAGRALLPPQPILLYLGAVAGDVPQGPGALLNHGGAGGGEETDEAGHGLVLHHGLGVLAAPRAEVGEQPGGLHLQRRVGVVVEESDDFGEEVGSTDDSAAFIHGVGGQGDERAQLDQSLVLSDGVGAEDQPQLFAHDLRFGWVGGWVE